MRTVINKKIEDWRGCAHSTPYDYKWLQTYNYNLQLWGSSPTPTHLCTTLQITGNEPWNVFILRTYVLIVCF